jgi:kynurenine formamidase
MKLIDLSQTIVNRMQVYPGDEPPMLHQIRTIAFDEFSNYLITTTMHVGTHVDGPAHMLDGKEAISEYKVDSFIGKGCIIDISNDKEFNNTAQVKEKAAGTDILIFYTGYGKLFGSYQYNSDYPVISEEVARTIAEMGIKLVGVDSFSLDMPPHLAHKALFAKDIFIAENLVNVDQLLTVKDFTIIALPVKVRADSALSRVVAMVNE